jgi:hypothetical protein
MGSEALLNFMDRVLDGLFWVSQEFLLRVEDQMEIISVVVGLQQSVGAIVNAKE